MTTQASIFRDLHTSAQPLVLFNAWDAGSAAAIADSGARAIATSSWAVAEASGYRDGEQLPFDRLVDSTRRITASVSLPVSVDAETGYGTTGEAVAANVLTLVREGAAGINLEDRDRSGSGLASIQDAAGRIAAIRSTLQAQGLDVFINARCDVFFTSGPDTATSETGRLKEAVQRAQAYLAAGADGIFLPGLSDPALVAQAAQAIPAPLNVMVRSPDAIASLREAGVRRISFGPAPYIAAMDALRGAARDAFAA
ncbi:isocitrate lyase/PEP mutase family protein [Glycocaulis sp.]|uniref:isocitrate lyase/PEP mutase family protein n=1 Tax=Glycocaulis sp. TaxID=1969725 RepID=UPI003D1BACEF